MLRDRCVAGCALSVRIPHRGCAGRAAIADRADHAGPGRMGKASLPTRPKGPMTAALAGRTTSPAKKAEAEAMDQHGSAMLTFFAVPGIAVRKSGGTEFGLGRGASPSPCHVRARSRIPRSMYPRLRPERRAGPIGHDRRSGAEGSLRLPGRLNDCFLGGEFQFRQ